MEKEPPGLLFSLILMGFAAALAATVLEELGESVLSAFLDPSSPAYTIALAFLVVAVVEEGGKLFFLKQRTWRDPNFNYRFDGVVYAVFVSLGFAALENINYVFGYGLQVAVPRALLAIPAHMLDLDNFKSINDTHGHAVGDTALQTSVRLLLQCLRSSDCVARYGGDEFCVLLQSVSMQDLESIVDRIRDRLDNFNHSGRAPYLLRFSMGYSVYDPASGWNAEDFTKEIDRRMYEDKRTNHREGIRS